MGKSLYIKRLVEKLEDITDNDICEVVIPVHGPKVNADSLVEMLNQHLGVEDPMIFHIDISETVIHTNEK